MDSPIFSIDCCMGDDEHEVPAEYVIRVGGRYISEICEAHLLEAVKEGCEAYPGWVVEVKKL